MEPARTTAISELDSPRASMGRDVATYLSIVNGEQDRYLDSLATATALLAGCEGGLPAAAALHARLAQQFMDAQRSILRAWADTDAKVARIAETTVLEAAMHGLDVRGRFDAVSPPESTAEHDLRRLLDRWWQVAREDGLARIEAAQADGARWLEVARLAATGDVAAPAVEHDPEPETARTSGPVAAMLPGDVTGVLDAVAGPTLHGMLDELVALLSEPGDASNDRSIGSPDIGPAPVSPIGAAPPPAMVLHPDGFDRFWASNRAIERARADRHVVRDAVVPMLLVVLLLVPVLLLIG